jgi:5-methylthioadenosine/S-adenosylhomocysteine deaminase
VLGAASGADQKPTLIRNAAIVLTMDSAVGQGPLGVLTGADVLIVGDTIAAVGKQLPSHDADVVDAAGKIVMPGFVDGHNHLWQSLIRGCGADADVNGWLAACVFPLSGFTFSQADAYAGVRLSTLDLVSTGVTTTVDWSHSFTPEFVRANIQALADSGLRFVFSYLGSTDPAVIADIRRVKQTLIDSNPKATLQVGSHPGVEPFFLPNLIAMANLAAELNVQLHVHLLENVSQVADQPFTALAQANALGPNLVGAHAIHLTDDEIQLLARSGARVVHNPLSNMRLASGVMRLPALEAAEVRVALGLDGGTNDTSDMFNNMRAALGLQRATTLRADVFPTVAQVLRMATVDGASLLNMSDRIGSLTVGKKADLIVLDPGAVNFSPSFETINQIVLNAQPRNVEWVFVDGRALKRNGRLIGLEGHGEAVLVSLDKYEKPDLTARRLSGSWDAYVRISYIVVASGDARVSRDAPFAAQRCTWARQMIRKLSSGKFRLYSRKKNPKTGRRRNLGTFGSRAAAERHEKAVQFFKRS